MGKKSKRHASRKKSIKKTIQPLQSKRSTGTSSFSLALVFAVCVSAIFVIVVAIFVTQHGEGSVTRSTQERTKVDANYEWVQDTLTDELGWVQDPEALNVSFKKFYEATGLIPYVALVSNHEIYHAETAEQLDSDLNNYAAEWYFNNLSHDGYVLLLYVDSDTVEHGGSYLVVFGDTAGQFFDDEARQILDDYIEKWGESGLAWDNVFANIFEDTAERIMTVTPESSETSGILIPMFGSVGIVCISAIILVWCKKKRGASSAS